LVISYWLEDKGQRLKEKGKKAGRPESLEAGMPGAWNEDEGAGLTAHG
jgi:hypothetical protein